ncbi:MAG: isochorismate synthase [Thermoleophilaceae bacterium]
MTVVETGAAAAPWLDTDSYARLVRHVDEALRLARRDGRRAVASVTVPVAAELDLSAIVFGARRADDRIFCLEQPERDGAALATLGEAAVIEARGDDRFGEASDAQRELVRRVLTDSLDADPARPDGAGPVFVGGFAFAPDGGDSPEWSSLQPCQLVLPEASFARSGGEARLTVCAAVDGDEAPGAVVERIEARLAQLRPTEMPLLDPDPAVRARVSSALPPSHHESAVERAVERIRAGELDKIVLAREVRVHAPAEIDPAPVFDGLRGVFPSCYCWALGTPELTYVGASPELLVRRDGARAQTVALAGTTRRSADPAVDAHLGEQLAASEKEREEHAIVAGGIKRILEPVSIWVTDADDPVLVKVQNLQHLATPIRAQLARPVATLELAGRLHPTPAVGGEPRAVAEPLIPALEGLDRGWYAGTIGWTDLNEDGEFFVALRCALLRGSVAHLYAGGGIVRDSDPAEELAETEVKLEALLPLLT